MQYSTAMAKSSSLIISTACNDVQWRAMVYNGVQRYELSQLVMALKQSLVNGFERNELGYHAHACPGAFMLTIFEAARLSQPRQ